MIADIYIRVSSDPQESGHGLARQRQICKEWCKDNGVEVREIIQDVCSAYTGEHLKTGNLAKAMDRWRKGYWEKKGEPLTEDECDEKVIPQLPPDYLIVEALDRFSRLTPMDCAITLLIMAGIGTNLVLVDCNKIITNEIVASLVEHTSEGKITVGRTP
jgi:DNA invertase Pin-like site-specific DNA recombinase